MAGLFHTGEIDWLTENSVAEITISDTVFQEFLEINTDAHTVDTRCWFSPPFSGSKHTITYYVCPLPVHEVPPPGWDITLSSC